MAGRHGGLWALLVFALGLLLAIVGLRQRMDSRRGIRWISLPGGPFLMGSNEGASNEQPVHPVRVGPFELMKTEITVAMYRGCVGHGQCSAPRTKDPGAQRMCNWSRSGRDKHPVICMTWGQARAFCQWAGGRLPSEAEWEYAARSGGKDRRYPWGNEAASCSRAVMQDGGPGCGRGSTWPVCSKRAGSSAQGVCDLAGNAWEWVEDAYHPGYGAAPLDGTAWTQGGGDLRVLRGGGWSPPAGALRAAARERLDAGAEVVGFGARCARQARP